MINSIKGATLQEILVVVAVFATILVMALPAFRASRDQQILKATTLEVYSIISKAKSQSLASLDSSEYGVYFQADKVVIFKGQSYSSSDPDNEETTITTPASVSAIVLTGGVTQIYFDRFSGMPSATGAVTISVGSLTQTLTISATGIISAD